MSAKQKAGVSWHPARNSPLTLDDVMTDRPALRLPKIEDFPAVDGVTYLREKYGRYLQAIEDVADQARRQGDVHLAAKLFGLLLRHAARCKKPPGSATPDPPEEPEPDLSGLSDEELRRLLGRKDSNG